MLRSLQDWALLGTFVVYGRRGGGGAPVHIRCGKNLAAFREVLQEELSTLGGDFGGESGDLKRSHSGVGTKSIWEIPAWEKGWFSQYEHSHSDMIPFF